MEELLQRMVDARLSRRAERALVGLHQRHFGRRVRVLDPVFFPGRERSTEAIESLGNGAYAEFSQVPDFDGDPAFHHVIRVALPALQFLYYWRTSATLHFLRKHASGALDARLKVMRNVRIHLREGFTRLESAVGEARWGLPEWPEKAGRAVDLRGLQVDLAGKRGKAALRAILTAADTPLTRSELAAVLLRCTHQDGPTEVATAHDMAADAPGPDAAVAEADVRARVDAFFDRLSADDVQLLKVRGYADAGRPKVPFPEVARRMGRLGAESWRLKERRILEVFRETFDATDAPAAVARLIERLDG